MKRKGMKRIALDIDGVVADFMLAFTTVANQMDNSLPVLRDEQVNEWNLSPWYCSKTTLSKIWNYLRKEEPFFWTKLEPLISAATFNRLIRNCAEVYFITSRIELGYVSAQRQTVGWLQEVCSVYQEFIPQVICNSHKKEMCGLLGVEYYLDDKPDNLLGFEGTKGYLLYKPYMEYNIVYSDTTNSSYYLYKDEAIPVVHTVDEFLDLAGL